MYYNEEFKIRTSDCNSKMFLHPSALLDLFQESGGRHSAMYGIDTPSLLDKHKVTWVLSGLAISIDESPKWPEDINIKTWLKSAKGFKAHRDFSIFNNIGNKIIDASSIWALIDIKTRRPIPLKTIEHNLEMSPDEHSIQGIIPGKVESKIDLDSKNIQKNQITVSRNDMDLNDHVSNITYVKWMFSYIDDEFLEANTLTNLNISYRGEACLNDVLKYTSIVENGVGYHIFTNRSSGRDICVIVSNWK